MLPNKSREEEEEGLRMTSLDWRQDLTIQKVGKKKKQEEEDEKDEEEKKGWR